MSSVALIEGTSADGAADARSDGSLATTAGVATTSSASGDSPLDVDVTLSSGRTIHIRREDWAVIISGVQLLLVAYIAYRQGKLA